MHHTKLWQTKSKDLNNVFCSLSFSLSVIVLSRLSPLLPDAEIHSVVNEAVRIDAAGRVTPERYHQCIATMI